MTPRSPRRAAPGRRAGRGLGAGFAGLGGGLRSPFGFPELAAQSFYFGLAKEPQLTAASAFDDAGFQELAQPLRAVPQVLGGHRKQYQAILPVHATSIWPYAKFYTLNSWRYPKYSAIIGETPNSGVMPMAQWPPVVKPIVGCPTEKKLEVWRRDQIWKALNACKDLAFSDQLRAWVNEVAPEPDGEYRGFNCSEAHGWPGWDDVLGAMPSLAECIAAWERGEDLPLPTEGPRGALPPVQKFGIVSQSMRFRVLERDNFTCQYCGRSAPEIAVEADHIEPRSKNGKAVFENLITACWDCNIGKGNRRLKNPSRFIKETP